MPKRGRAFEIVVAALEHALLANSGVSVSTPGSLIDQVTGEAREIDVLIEFNQGHHSFRVGIECRDRSRPVGTPEVEAYITKCRDTGVSRSVIVSSSGFTKPARKKAAAQNIDCLSISDVEGFDWLATPSLMVYRKRLNHISIRLGVPAATVETVQRDPLELFTADQEPLSRDALTNNLKTYLEAITPPLEPAGLHQLPFRLSGEGLLVRTRTGEVSEVTAINGVAHWQVDLDALPFTLLRYSDDEKAHEIAEAALVQLHEGPLEGSFVITKSQSGTAVGFVPKKT